MESRNVERKLAAILSADVKGYSRLMGDDEVATIHTLTAYRTLMTTLIQQYRGRVVDSPGDNLLAEFASVVDAVHCAITIQKELKGRNVVLPISRRMEFRIGLNVGDVIVEGERIYGDGVNIAARLEGLAEPGGICISAAVYDQVENKLTALDIRYDYLGEQIVKNIAKPVPAYQVRMGEIATAVGEDKGEAGGETLLQGTSPFQVSERTQTLPVPNKPSIAVLPFANLSGDPEQEYFSDGITEDLITDLSKLSGLFVIARNSVFLYKGKAIKPEQISQALGVRYVLEGSVRKAGNRVRITAQLIDTTTRYHLWAERYDRELQDIFAVQDEVTRKIVTALEIKLTEGEQKRLGRAATNNVEAYEYFLRGLEYYHSRRVQEANTQARQMFEQALALDPKFAAAYAWLGRTYVIEWMQQWSNDPQLPQRTAALAQQALSLDESLPGAHQTLAYVYLLNKQFDEALVEAERAVILDPNEADACVTLAEVLSCAGRPQEAIGFVEKALRLNPHYPSSYVFALGQAYYLVGRREEAITAFKRVLTRNPEHLQAHFFLAVIYSELGRQEEARTEIAVSTKISPSYSLQRVKDRIPYRDPTLVERWMATLRELGAE
jgi:adenylate cyclase